MIKVYCNVCNEEIKDQRFRCEIFVKAIKELSQVSGGQFNIQPRLVENIYHLCEKCFNAKLGL